MRRLMIVAFIALFALPVLASDLHVVSFSGKAPADFAAQVAALGGSVEFVHDGAQVASVRGLTDDAAALLASRQGIQRIDRDVDFMVAPVAEDFADLAVSDGAQSPSAPATAFFFPRQWHLRAIGADTAWAAGYLGKPDVTVAVLDTGIGYTHTDLIGRVDLSRSISLRNGPGTADEFYQNALYGALNMHPVNDLHYHGTHVASTIASNAIVSAGMTSGVTLMGVKVLDVFGSGNTTYTVQGILHAADNGADVINMSLGGGFPKNDYNGLGAYLNRALNYAYRKGVLVVVSAGNDSEDLDHNGNVYSTYCDAPNVVCVSATGPTNNTTVGPWLNVDSPASYTNFGRSAVTVAAPGGNGSAVWAACSYRTAYNLNCRLSPNYTIGLAGTSMASPHVAGLAALLVGEIGHGKPALVRARIMQSADDLGQPGTDPYYGKGRINVARALGVQ